MRLRNRSIKITPFGDKYLCAVCNICTLNYCDIGWLNSNNKRELWLRNIQSHAKNERKKLLMNSLLIFFHVGCIILDTGIKAYKLYFEATVLRLRSLYFIFELLCVSFWWEPAAQVCREGQVQPEDITEIQVYKRTWVLSSTHRFHASAARTWAMPEESLAPQNSLREGDWSKEHLPLTQSH